MEVFLLVFLQSVAVSPRNIPRHNQLSYKSENMAAAMTAIRKNTWVLSVSYPSPAYTQMGGSVGSILFTYYFFLRSRGRLAVREPILS